MLLLQEAKEKTSKTAITKSDKMFSVVFFMMNTSQNLKYKNGSSSPRYIQYRLPPKIINSKADKSTLLFTFLNNLYGSVADRKIPAMKKGNIDPNISGSHTEKPTMRLSRKRGKVS